MYNCQVCSSPSKPNAKVVKLIIYREKTISVVRTSFNSEAKPFRETTDKVVREIAKELQVCQLCHDGHIAGIPLDRLATMHRPKPKVLTPPTYGPAHSLAGVAVSSPREAVGFTTHPLATAMERLGQHVAQRVNQIALDALLESRPDGGRTRKAPPLKAARQHQKVKYENRAKKQQQAKA